MGFFPSEFRCLCSLNNDVLYQILAYKFQNIETKWWLVSEFTSYNMVYYYLYHCLPSLSRMIQAYEGCILRYLVHVR